MPAPSSIFRRASLLIGLFVLAVLAAVLMGRVSAARDRAERTPVAAYLVPLDADVRVKLTWWRSTAVVVPLALPSGKVVVIPAGARLKIIHASTGESEILSGPARLELQQDPPDEPQALISPMRELIPALQAQLNQQRAIFAITSPVGITRYLNPLITWTAQEGVLYDIAVADAADPLIPTRIARGMKPPVPLAELQTPQRRQLTADRNYEIAIRVAGAPKLSGIARFLTAANAEATTAPPTAPAELIAEALAAMAKKPSRTGDAWLALAALPADWARSEPAVRLRLRLAAELGLTREFQRAHDDARTLPRH